MSCIPETILDRKVAAYLDRQDTTYQKGLFPLWDAFYTMGAVSDRDEWKKVGSGFVSIEAPMKDYFYYVARHMFVTRYIEESTRARATGGPYFIPSLGRTADRVTLFFPQDVWGYDKDYTSNKSVPLSEAPLPPTKPMTHPKTYSNIDGLRWKRVRVCDPFKQPSGSEAAFTFEIRAWADMFQFMNTKGIMGPPIMTQCPPNKDPDCSRHIDGYIRSKCIPAYKSMLKAFTDLAMPFTDAYMYDAFSDFLKEFQVRLVKDFEMRGVRAPALVTQRAIHDAVADVLGFHAQAAQFHEKATIMSLGASVWALFQRSLYARPGKHEGPWFWGYLQRDKVAKSGEVDATIQEYKKTPFMRLILRMLEPNPYKRISVNDLMYETGKLGAKDVDDTTKFNILLHSVGGRNSERLMEMYDGSKPAYKSILAPTQTSEARPARRLSGGKKLKPTAS